MNTKALNRKPPDTSPTTSTLPLADLVEDYLASCRARGLSLSTVEQVYGYALKFIFLRWCETMNIHSLARLDQRTMDGFTSALLTMTTRRGARLSRASIHMYVRTVRQFLQWCQQAGEQGASGRPQLPRLSRRVIDTLTREEILKMEGAAESDRDRLIVRVLADTGIRVGELCALRVADLTTQERRTLLKVHGKGDKERLVPTPPAISRRLQRYLAIRPDNIQRPELFLSKRRDINGEHLPLTRSGVLQLLRNLARRAGITKRVHPHLFRHSFATEALRRGMNPIQLAQILGHSGLRMIDSVYSHLTANDAYDALIKAFADN